VKAGKCLKLLKFIDMKKTFIRFQHGKNTLGHPEVYCQVIEKFPPTIAWDVIGTLTFTKFREQFTFNTAEVRSDRHENFLKMTKIVKTLNENTFFDSDIIECLNVLNYEEQIIFGQELVGLSDNGKFIYNLFADEKMEKIYTRFVATNDFEAAKFVRKHYPQYEGLWQSYKRISVESVLFNSGNYSLSKLVLNHPFFASIALRMKYV
jgi:hypothetical protein